MFTSIFQWYFGGNHLMMRRRWWHSGLRVEEKIVFGEQVQWFNYFIGSSQIKVPKRDPDQTSWFATWKLPEYGVIYCVSGQKKMHLLQADLTNLFFIPPTSLLENPTWPWPVIHCLTSPISLSNSRFMLLKSLELLVFVASTCFDTSRLLLKTLQILLKLKTLDFFLIASIQIIYINICKPH